MRRAVIAVVFATIVGLAATLLYMTSMPGESFPGPLPALSEAEIAMAQQLRAHVAAIATRPHNVERYDELEKSALYIEKTLSYLGYEITRESYAVSGKVVRNIEATLEPADPLRMRGTIVIGAHYDLYDDAPGANDNATGVAGALVLARQLSDLRGKSDVRIRIVLFVNEEPPYFHTADMGSRRYAQNLVRKGEPVIGMISLETMGYFSDEPNSQQYPPPLGLLYPQKGDFIAFVGMPRSREFVREVVQSFRRHTSFPSVGGVAPGFIPGIDWSDHASFADWGIPALMITDTAEFRYPHYHKPTDTIDKVNTEKLARVTTGIERVIRDIAQPSWPTAAVRSTR